MYTVIVADDEEEIRRGIIRKVRWEELGFRVVGELRRVLPRSNECIELFVAER